MLSKTDASNIVVISQRSADLRDKAAVKAVQALPAYSAPAMNGGAPVPFRVVMPVRFVPE